MSNQRQNLIANEQGAQSLSDFELSKVTRFFQIMLMLEKRAQEENDLRTDKEK